MKKTWNALFRSRRNLNEDRGYDRHDDLANAYFLSRTGTPLEAVLGTRPDPRTGEFTLGD